jgi:hypothetical protein
MPNEASAYIEAADGILLEQLDYRDAAMAQLLLAEAQVHAIKAVAAAVDRLAATLEKLLAQGPLGG